LPHSLVRRFAFFCAIFATASLAGCGPPEMIPVPPPPPQPTPPYRPPPAPSAAAKVGLLVPLSGVNGKLGKAMLDAAGLALFESGGKRIVLVPRDTAGTSAGAAKAAQEVTRESVRLILGPLLEGDVRAVEPVAQEAGTNVIAFSTATGLAGGNVFLMGFLPREEVIREVSYARDQGYRRFAALAPNSAYGHIMVEALRDAVSRSGAEVTQIAFYDPQKGDLSAVIAHLLGKSGGGAESGPDPSAAPSEASPGFDALLLPEGGARLKEIAHLLVASGLDTSRVRLLGSGLWDEPDTGQERALDGGWFAASDPAARGEFMQRFESAYGYKPPRLASLAYDAAALAAALASGEVGRPFSRAAILNPRGFSGVDGLFRFRPNGLVERALAILQVGPQGNEVLSPAPQSFENIAY
jgi:ABC-type branched-subunit amino acid transport system substrate-binding protein